MNIISIPTNFGIWSQIFFKGLNQKSAFYNKGFFYSKAILKVSWKNIEKRLSYNEFVGIDYAHVANWDMGDLVLFLRLFDHRIHI